MNAKEYLQVALGGNMNFGTLKPLAIEEIMEAYAKQCAPDSAGGEAVSSSTLLEFIEEVKTFMGVCSAQEMPIIGSSNRDVVRKERLDYFASKERIWETINRVNSNAPAERRVSP